MTDKEKIITDLKQALDGLDITSSLRLVLINTIEYLQQKPVSIWHDLSEKADIHKGNVVAVNSVGEAAAFNQGSTAIRFMNDYDIERWAYINDLLKL